MLRTLTIASFLSLGLLACGGGSKPAPAAPEETEEADESADEPSDDPSEDEGTEVCCCVVFTEDGSDPTAELVPPESCEESGGECSGDPASCGMDEEEE